MIAGVGALEVASPLASRKVAGPLSFVVVTKMFVTTCASPRHAVIKAARQADT